MADVFAYLEGFGVSGGSPNKSTIIVTAPTGSTVTCKMGSTTKTATEKMVSGHSAGLTWARGRLHPRRAETAQLRTLPLLA